MNRTACCLAARAKLLTGKPFVLDSPEMRLARSPNAFQRPPCAGGILEVDHSGNSNSIPRRIQGCKTGNGAKSGGLISRTSVPGVTALAGQDRRRAPRTSRRSRRSNGLRPGGIRQSQRHKDTTAERHDGTNKRHNGTTGSALGQHGGPCTRARILTGPEWHWTAAANKVGIGTGRARRRSESGFVPPQGDGGTLRSYCREFTMRYCELSRLGALLLLVITLGPSSTLGQESQPPQGDLLAQLPTIPDEPKLVDPATLMPEKLAARATVDFSDSSLRELVDWLRSEQGLVVLLEKNALSEIGVFPTDTIIDRLDDSPIYLLLNRLRLHRLAWYFQDDILYITSPEAAEQHPLTIPYSVGDLLDDGYDADDLETLISSTISPDEWDTVGGVGVLSFLGDVLFVRQTDDVQREVQGLLKALRQHGRQTFIYDPPQHSVLRQRLAENVSVDFLDTPLESAVSDLAAAAKADIRLDVPALRDNRIREREPVTLKLADRSLKTVLQAMVMDLELTWMLQDGVLWITTAERGGGVPQDGRLRRSRPMSRPGRIGIAEGGHPVADGQQRLGRSRGPRFPAFCAAWNAGRSQ